MLFSFLFFLHIIVFSHATLYLSELILPKDFSISVYANQVPLIRSLVSDPTGDVVYAGSYFGCNSTTEGPVYALIDSDMDGSLDQAINLTIPLVCPNGVALLNGDLYVALIDTLIRFPDIHNKISQAPLSNYDVITLTPPLPSDTYNGRRYLRAVQGNLYITLGSPCNVPGDPNTNCTDDYNPLYGVIAQITFTDPTNAVLTPIARGVRNGGGIDVCPDGGGVWFTDNGRTNWDPNHSLRPPDELNTIPSDGQVHHFGFPYCYGWASADNNFYNGSCLPNYTGAALPLAPHSAPLGFRFYPANGSNGVFYLSNASLFPSGYMGDIFISTHGSYNSQPPHGYEILRIIMNGSLVSNLQSFISGWLWDPLRYCQSDSDCGGTSQCQTGSDYQPPYYCSGWGRPVDIEVLLDGSLLISDDQNGVVYRVVYEGADSFEWWKGPGGIVVFIISFTLIGIALYIAKKVHRIVTQPSRPRLYPYQQLQGEAPLD